MASLLRPSRAAVLAQLEQLRAAELTFAQAGLTRDDAPPPAGYVRDHYRCALGAGEACWQAARAALAGWQMQGMPWLELIAFDDGAQQPGERVASLTWFGLWWVAPCRIVYRVDEPDRVGFAFATLPGHPELGEERFLVERDAAGAVSYDLLAVSRPATWATRLGYPLARRLQRAFGRDSQLAMQRACASAD